MKVKKPFKPTGKRLDNLNRLIQTEYPQDKWILDKVLPPFLSIIDSSSTLEQQEMVVNMLNKLFNTYEFRYNVILETINMTNEQLRMQMLAGVITEGEYTAIINKQIEEADKESLNESMIGGIVGVGAVTQIPSRAKADYEMAFEHFLGERYLTNFENREQDPYKMEEGKEKIDEMDEDDELEDLIDWAQTKLWGDFDYDEYEVKKMSPQKLYYELENLIYSYDPDYTKFKKFESMVNEEVKKEVKENATPNLYMDLKNTLFPYYTDLTGEERVTMIDKIIKELNAYISILQNEKNTK
jgi:hypothetical protein